MHVNEVKYFDVIPIDSYGPGIFRVGGKIFKGAIVCSSLGVSSWSGYKDFNRIKNFGFIGKQLYILNETKKI